MNKFYITILSIVLLSIASQAQIVKGIVFTTGGSFAVPGNHIKLYKFNNSDFSSAIFDSIPGDYSNHIAVQSQYAYVHIGRAAGHPLGLDRIYKYDLTNQSAGAIDSTDEISGIQKFAIYNNRIVITRGYPATSAYVEIVDKNDLSTSLYSDNSISGSCNGVVIENQKAYISATNYGVGGVIHVIDLDATIANEGSIQMDTLSVGAKDIFADNGMLYITNLRYKPNYSVWYAGVTSLNLSDSSFVTDTTGLTNAKGFSYENDHILGDFGNPIEYYKVSTGARNQLFPYSATAVLSDPNGMGYAVQSTDYFSYGKVEFMDNIGNVGLTINTDISGSAMAGVANFIPIAVNDTVTHNLGSLPNLSPFLIDVLVNDYDMDGDSLVIDSVLSANAIIVGTKIEYDPNITGVSADTFSYVISDAWGDMDTATVYLDFLTGVNEVEASFSSIYPNPTTDILKIGTENGQIVNLQIVDLSGRIVIIKNTVLNGTAMDVSNLNAGIYFVRINAKGISETHKLIIQ